MMFTIVDAGMKFPLIKVELTYMVKGPSAIEVREKILWWPSSSVIQVGIDESLYDLVYEYTNVWQSYVASILYLILSSGVPTM